MINIVLLENQEQERVSRIFEEKNKLTISTGDVFVLI
jgi:hypothetical protein